MRYVKTLILVLTGLSAPSLAKPNVRLYGALVAEACVIPPGDEEITLNFGTIIDKYLYQHARTFGQAFNLRLTGCDASVVSTVKVTFHGMENPSLPGLLAIDSSSQASGIAIGLETSTYKPVLINKVSDRYALQQGENNIALRAYVQAEPAALRNQSIARGPFSATATFSLEYE